MPIARLTIVEGVLAALLVLFLALVSTRMKSNDVFFKKRRKQK